MTDSDWSDDHPIDELIDKMTAEMRELFLSAQPGNVPDILADDPGFEVYFNHVRTKLAVDANALIGLSPPEIWESYHGLGAAGGETFAGEMNRVIDAVKSSISDWEGKAAEAFGKHVTDIRTFVGFQAKYVDETLQRLAASYKLAVQIREDYRTLVKSWIQVSQDYRESKEEKQLEVKLKVGAGIVASVVALATAPEVVGAGLAAGASAIGAIVDGYAGAVGGGNAGDICDSYQRTYDRLRQSYEHELEQLRTFVEDRNSTISAEKVHMYEPLPGICDVDGPDFRYDNFFHDFTPPGGYAGKVEAERKKYVSEKTEPHGLSEGPIYQVLSGADVDEPR